MPDMFVPLGLLVAVIVVMWLMKSGAASGVERRQCARREQTRRQWETRFRRVHGVDPGDRDWDAHLHAAEVSREVGDWHPDPTLERDYRPRG